jgi:UPF0716 family protein affecting phage T7 exclusion
VILLFLIGYPLAEVAVAIGLAQLVGWWPVIAAQFIGLIVGALLIRRAPVSGLLIAVPGFLTDVIGLLLLIPVVRRTVAQTAMAAVAHRLGVRLDASSGGRVPGGSTVAPPRGDVVRGEVVERHDEPPATH